MKRYRNLLILAAVLALLVGAYFLISSLSKKGGTEAETTLPESYTAASVAPEQLVSVKITVKEDDGERVLSFSLSDDAASWKWSEDGDVPLDNSGFASMVSALNGAVTDVRMESVGASDLEKYGLNEPALRAEFGYSDGKKAEYIIGGYNSFNSKYYFSEASEPGTVYMVSSSVFNALNVTVPDLIKKDEIPSVTPSRDTSVAFDIGGKKYVYSYYPNGSGTDYTDAYKWYLSVDGGKPIRVGTGAGKDIDGMLSGLYTRDVAAYTDIDLSSFGLTDPVTMTVSYTRTDKITDSQTGETKEAAVPASYVLKIGAQDEGGDYYVVTETSKLVYTAAYSDVIEMLTAEDPRSVMPETVEDINYALVEKAVFTAGGKSASVILSHNTDGTGYAYAGGGAVDAEKFSAVTAALHALKVDTYSDLVERDAAQSADPIFSLTLSFNYEGASDMTLSLIPYTENYCLVSFAGREDQLVLRDSLTDLLDAVSALAEGAA